MKKSEFYTICANHDIDPSIALENKIVYDFLASQKMQRTENCLAELDKIFKEQF